MNVKYRSYGENKQLTILAVIVMASFWIFMGIDELFKIKFAVFWRVLLLHFLLLIALGIMAYMKNRFIADDYSVTFARVLSRKITINYIDIDEITVYNQLKRGRVRHIYHNFYVEVIAFKTLDGKEYVFKNINIAIIEKQQVIISKENSPSIHFVIHHPKLIDAIYELIDLKLDNEQISDKERYEIVLNNTVIRNLNNSDDLSKKKS